MSFYFCSSELNNNYYRTQIQSFLTLNAVPQLTAGLVCLAREQPADPITFLSEYLGRLSDERQEAACAEAKEQFYTLLHQTNA